ncbi:MULTISPECIES: dTDP-4-dehydrorhamnose reductase [unclassified Kaistella]|uniref:dTDP-4-dehydrorhamnose reductase n=1 Tax=unclassified Kaistella TaxID=2762626 RepID=UPI00273731A3|nr:MULTISPECIES: dTDP-4-dehydrorhamnose reductase [unclassified Kaistella]MDP2452707.1 dTDP-4-dehydrorhamnose reductase [Kaistella sp. SH11-4b]MDP2455616.1 dTDP-4-dehydrorhamnose reductase [Kaistella sp. SH40-3]MDP2458520.1 dTDP-4-dehydrorhamnose reductase [Kaistella sp. SH19-2b]
MKKILVIGGNGQLGNCFKKIAPDFSNNFEFNFAGSEDLDITDSNAVDNFFEDYQPDFCINAAAYTAVDLAETEIEKAFAVNASGVANVAEACRKSKTILIHISTDYVFDGESNISYSEDNFTNPQGVYGASKLKGEELALEHNPKTIVIRTSWLYSEFNKNFVKTMLNLFTIKDELGIVSDQFGQPTNANDLATTVMKIISSEPKVFGVFHFSNYPETNWFDFAKKIAEFSDSKIKLKAITTEEFPTPAKRPKRSTMALDKIEEVYGVEPIHWENALEECIEILATTHE